MHTTCSNEFHMKVHFNYINEFERRARFLAKKYKSFQTDYETFLNSLETDPFQGISLGKNVYKTRMAISSKGKGKSGGARVLTYNIKKVKPEILVITLLSIFDKGEMENVSDSYIKGLVKEMEKMYSNELRK